MKFWFGSSAGGAHCQSASSNTLKGVLRAQQRVRQQQERVFSAVCFASGHLLTFIFLNVPSGLFILAGVMRIRNNKGKYPMDVCNNNKTRTILRQTFAHLTFIPTTVKSDETPGSGRSKADKLRHKVKTAKRCVSVQLLSLYVVRSPVVLQECMSSEIRRHSCSRLFASHRHDGSTLNNRSAQAQYHRYGKLRTNGL